MKPPLYHRLFGYNPGCLPNPQFAVFEYGITEFIRMILTSIFSSPSRKFVGKVAPAVAVRGLGEFESGWAVRRCNIIPIGRSWRCWQRRATCKRTTPREDEKEIVQQWLTDFQEKGLTYTLTEKKLEKEACLMAPTKARSSARPSVCSTTPPPTKPWPAPSTPMAMAKLQYVFVMP